MRFSPVQKRCLKPTAKREHRVREAALSLHRQNESETKKEKSRTTLLKNSYFYYLKNLEI